MSKKNNNKGKVQPEVEQPVEQVVESEAIVIDPEVFKAEASEISTEVETVVDTEVETEVDTVAETVVDTEVETEIKPVEVDPITGNINVKFEFKDEYNFGLGNGDAIIDTLPEEKTREEKINEIVEAESKIFEAEEEKFLNKTVEEIVESPVYDDDGECDGECEDDCCIEEAKPEEKNLVLYMGKLINLPKGKNLGDYSRSDMNIFLNTGKLPE